MSLSMTIVAVLAVAVVVAVPHLQMTLTNNAPDLDGLAVCPFNVVYGDKFNEIICVQSGNSCVQLVLKVGNARYNASCVPVMKPSDISAEAVVSV